MRWAVIVLVAANLAFWVWSQGAAQTRAAQSDTERVAQQVRAQAVTVAPLAAAETGASGR